jgi:hypothetical protein
MSKSLRDTLREMAILLSFASVRWPADRGRGFNGPESLEAGGICFCETP